MSAIQGTTLRIRIAAACLALACAGMVSAEPAAPPQAPAAGGMTHERMRAMMQERHAEHVTALLDHLAARLEIKASQEPAWQAFSASFRELMTAPQHAETVAGGAPHDAATLAREHADHAADHAQKLARMADATAKLEQALGPDQREVLDEAARRFAHHDGGHSWMAHHDGREGYGDHEGAHCDAHSGHDALHRGMHGYDEHDDDDDAPHHAQPH